MSVVGEVLAADGKVIGPRGAKAFKKWEPKKWLPIYEAIVALSATGLSNEEVGRRFGYGAQQVSNIRNTPQGKALMEIIRQKIHDEQTMSIGERLAKINENALRHVENLMAMDPSDFKNPLPVFDRALAVLKSTGKVAGEQSAATGGNTTVNVHNNTAMILPSPQAERLREALALSNQVKVIHGGA